MKPMFVSFLNIAILMSCLWITICKAQRRHNTRNSASESVGHSYFFYQQPDYPRDCYEALSQCSAANSSDVYLVRPDGYPDAFEVYCNNDIDGGGWTVVHRRIDGAIDFNRAWTEYTSGFGFLSSEFWLGLDKLSFLTNQNVYEIRIDMENAVGSSLFVHYNRFRISDGWGDFRITDLGQFSGTASSFIVECPPNMEYGNCTCQASCEDPENTMDCQTTCSEDETCICQEGFLRKGDDCVPPRECSCFIEGEGVILNGNTKVNVDCTSRCECQSNILTCDNNYRCSSDATCEERGGVRQCYCNDGYTGDGQNCDVVATDCADIYNAGITDSGVYTIKPTDWPGSPFEVYCNMTDGGGWTVFQRRVNGLQDFYLGWTMYRNGFGTPNHELWLGNEKTHYMTNNKNYQLRIDMVDRNGSPFYAKYNLFRISNENDKYRLVGLGTFSGNAGWDALKYHRHDPFSTYDRDNDDSGTYNCAERHRGAWWYRWFARTTHSGCRTTEARCDYWPEGSACNICGEANLNGDYDSTARGTSIHWTGSIGYDCNLIYTEMKIKPV